MIEIRYLKAALPPSLLGVGLDLVCSKACPISFATSHKPRQCPAYAQQAGQTCGKISLSSLATVQALRVNRYALPARPSQPKKVPSSRAPARPQHASLCKPQCASLSFIYSLAMPRSVVVLNEKLQNYRKIQKPPPSENRLSLSCVAATEEVPGNTTIARHYEADLEDLCENLSIRRSRGCDQRVGAAAGSQKQQGFLIAYGSSNAEDETF